MARLRCASSQRLTYQNCEPLPTLAQAVQHSHIGDIGEADRRRPCGCRSQASLAKTVGKDQPKQIDRIARSRVDARTLSSRVL